MALEEGGKRIFDLAKERAIEIVEDGNEGDAYSLILMTDTARTVVGTAAFDRGDFLEEIENLHFLHGGADMPAALASAGEVVQVKH